MLIIDFETRSRVDLQKCGADKYARDTSTDIICLVVMPSTPGDDRRWVWEPNSATAPMLLDELERVRLGFQFIAAHQARFDKLIWRYIAVERYGFPELPDDRWYCTSAQARVNALPASLDDATRALKANHRKSHTGVNLIRQLSIPQADGSFNKDPVLIEQMVSYCIADVRATKDLINGTRVLTAEEHQDWLVNEQINDRGVGIDIELAELATDCADKEADELAAELSQLTSKQVTKHTQSARLRKWVLQQLPNGSPVAQIMTTTEGKFSLAKDIRQQILDKADAKQLDVPDRVYNVIAAMDEGNKSSVAKFKRMVAHACDGRVHGSFVYAGASTIRYSARGLQLHNFRRDCLAPDDADALKAHLRAGNTPSNIMDTLSRALRPALITENGNAFVVGDWASIENRVLPWLSDSAGGNAKLDLFRDIDADSTLDDMYVRAAEAAGDYSRQVGKVIELSLGFGGSLGAFKAMAKNYGVDLSDRKIADIVKVWRQRNPWAVAFWHKLYDAAFSAMRKPFKQFYAGKVSYMYLPELNSGSLICELPCGQLITYPYARMDYDGISALKANWKPGKDDIEWPRYNLWHGLLAENVTQGTSASLLRWVLRQQPDAVLHCHDEIALEVPRGRSANIAKLKLQSDMEEGPAWAENLPLKAPVKIMTRYGK